MLLLIIFLWLPCSSYSQPKQFEVKFHVHFPPKFFRSHWSQMWDDISVFWSVTIRERIPAGSWDGIRFTVPEQSWFFNVFFLKLSALYLFQFLSFLAWVMSENGSLYRKWAMISRRRNYARIHTRLSLVWRTTTRVSSTFFLHYPQCCSTAFMDFDSPTFTLGFSLIRRQNNGTSARNEDLAVRFCF